MARELLAAQPPEVSYLQTRHGPALRLSMLNECSKDREVALAHVVRERFWPGPDTIGESPGGADGTTPTIRIPDGPRRAHEENTCTEVGDELMFARALASRAWARSERYLNIIDLGPSRAAI